MSRKCFLGENPVTLQDERTLRLEHCNIHVWREDEETVCIIRIINKGWLPVCEETLERVSAFN